MDAPCSESNQASVPFNVCVRHSFQKATGLWAMHRLNSAAIVTPGYEQAHILQNTNSMRG
jgi:hypothetical protein